MILSKHHTGLAILTTGGLPSPYVQSTLDTKHTNRFQVSPDGTTAYIAYLDSSETDVHVQQVDPSTFAAVGTAVTVTGGKEGT